MKQIKVMLVDRVCVFLEGLKRILADEPRIEVVCTCQDGLRSINEARNLKPDVALLGTEISGGDYVNVIRYIKKTLPEVYIIVLTHSQKDFNVSSALMAGARAFLSEDTGATDLVNDIIRVGEGEVILSPLMAERLLQEYREFDERKKTAQDGHYAGLSNREMEVLSLVVQGKTNREIAGALFIAECTVKVHLSKILEKLNVRNRQQVVAMAIEKSILPGLTKRDE